MKNILAAGYVFVSTALILVACSAAQQKAEVQAGVVVAEDVCKEVVDVGLAPGWVALLCDAGSGVAKVVLPTAQWHAIKLSGARHGQAVADAGVSD